MLHAAVCVAPRHGSKAGTFAPGEKEQTVSATVKDDAHNENEETIALILSNATVEPRA